MSYLRANEGGNRGKRGRRDPHHHANLRRGSNTTRSQRNGAAACVSELQAPMAEAALGFGEGKAARIEGSPEGKP